MIKKNKVWFFEFTGKQTRWKISRKNRKTGFELKKNWKRKKKKKTNEPTNYGKNKKKLKNFFFLYWKVLQVKQ